MKTTGTFDKALQAIVTGKRVVALQSGMRTGKSYSLTQIAVLLALNKQDYVILVVCPSFRHLKTGAFRDLQNVIKAENLTEEVEFNYTNYSVRFKHTDARIEYCAVMESGEESIRGRSCDVAWFNEINISADYQIYQAIAGRCRVQIWADYNPSGPKNWWFESKVMVDIENTIKVKCSIADNPFLSKAQIEEIYRTARFDENFKAVYLDGEYANISELQILTNYDILPHDDFEKVFSTATNHAFGVDFGFVTSYSTVCELAMVGGELYVREHVYARSLLNHELADYILKSSIHNLKRGVADSAEIKSIDDINDYSGQKIHLQPSIKGKDSVLFGLTALKQVKIHIDSDSQHIINDFANYEWTRDKVTGEILAIPNKQAYDAHTVDCIRYAYTTFFNNNRNSKSYLL